MKPITKELIDSIHSALDKGLTKGLGKPIKGQMCVEALISFKLGLPHGDNPPCVGSEVRKAKIALNDCHWSSNKARAEGMRKLAIAQLGSDEIDQAEFHSKLKLNSCKFILPFLIQKHFDTTKDTLLLEYKSRFEQLVELDNELWEEFYKNYNYNYYNYNNYNHYYYNYYYYNYNYYYYYNYYNARSMNDNLLLVVAKAILQTLIDLKSPGCKWL